MRPASRVATKTSTHALRSHRATKTYQIVSKSGDFDSFSMAPANPTCYCSLPAVRRTVKKNTANYGKRFLACSRKSWEQPCNFFQWSEEGPQDVKEVAGLSTQRTDSAPDAARAATRARVVYRLPVADAPCRELVEATQFGRMVDRCGREQAMAGGLRCEQGCPMTFVRSHVRAGTEVNAHFSHLPQTVGAAEHGNGASALAQATCGCSDEHLYAQHLLVRHVRAIKVCRFKSCGRCVEYTYGPRPDAHAELEVTGRNAQGKSIRSDVAVTSPRGSRIATLEVRRSHATDPASRDGVVYYEVSAEHVIHMLDGQDGRQVITLNGENTTTPCVSCTKYEQLQRIDQELAAVTKRLCEDDSDWGNTSDRNEKIRLQRMRTLAEKGIAFEFCGSGVVEIINPRGERMKLGLASGKVCFHGRDWHSCDTDTLIRVCKAR